MPCADLSATKYPKDTKLKKNYKLKLQKNEVKNNDNRMIQTGSIQTHCGSQK